MTNPTIIRAGEDPSNYSREVVGGKGLYLLRLHQIAKNTGMFNVPNYFIVPTNAERSFRNDESGTRVIYKSEDIRSAFEQLRRPVAVRSSSPLEDGIKASFAGMFTSILDQQDYEQMTRSANTVYESAFQDRVQRYAERMGIEMSDAMALIIQEQVTNFWERGIIQLEYDKAVTETTDRKGRTNEHETEFRFFDECGPFKPYLEDHDYISEGESHYVVQCAREAKKRLGLDGVVQVEFFLSPSKLPDFVQIRQLPKAKSYSAQLDLDVPTGVPYIESEICNDIAGDLTLPVYVTTSQAGLKRILIETGQSFFMGMGRFDERAEVFNERSALAQNRDFQRFRDLSMHERMGGVEAILPLYAKTWQEGNKLFSDYILVCDKLDESIASMADVTTNKRAIITCLEAKKTSHAMTVARDLGIMCMGVNGDLHELEPEFFHKVETGDRVRMKSDGRRAVAYIEKKRESDPYEKLVSWST